jgi:CBS domain-containing protein
MKIQDLMTTGARACRASDNLSVAAQAMWEGDLGWLPVLDEDRRVVGVITDRDITMAAHLRGSPLWALSVGDAMAKVVYTVASDERLRAASRLMAEHQLRRLPVVDADGRLAGVVTLATFAQAAAGNGRLPVKPREVAGMLAAITAPRVPQLAERLVVEVIRDAEPDAVLQPRPRKAAKRRKQNERRGAKKPARSRAG